MWKFISIENPFADGHKIENYLYLFEEICNTFYFL